jgi:L-amino acid N-acyltransferase YncA
MTFSPLALHAITVRESREDDVPAIAAIYREAVLHGTASFELEAPAPEEIARRRQALLDADYPYLVATVDGAVVAYAYAGPFRPRAAYRHTVEDSIYVADGWQGRGVGRTLLAALLQRCEALGFRQVIAVIGDSASAGSIALHRTLGFADAGLLPAVGYKHGAWRDIVLMQRALGAGATESPDR